MARVPFHIGSSLSIETAAGTLASARRMELLASIGVHHSIAAAAREVGLTYKAAWDAVDAMNNLAGEALVERSVGGRGGGGATLTPRGNELVNAFVKVQRENAKFMRSANRQVSEATAETGLMNRLATFTSARNQVSGTVLRIEKGAVNDVVVLSLSGGRSISAVVTRQSVADLNLKKGAVAIALIKASSVIVAAGDTASLRLSARNQLSGKVARITRGAVNDEVVIDLQGGATIAAIITHASAQHLKLARGSAATAVFKASSVILAVAG